MMKRYLIILIVAFIPIFGICGNESESIIGSQYSSTITEPFSTNIYGESLTSQNTISLMSMPIDPGEPIPDPITTPLEDTPYFMLIILLITYSLYKYKHKKKA